MSEKQYHYFISYQYRNKEESGFGQITLLLSVRVSGPNQIDELIEHIRNRFKFDSVVLINLMLLNEEVVNIS